MERDELKGRQTPGEWYHVGGSDTRTAPFIRVVGEELPGSGMAMAKICRRGSFDEQAANAALIAEAGTVANETNMWPREMQERIKKLEGVLSGILERMDDEAYDEPHFEAVNAFVDEARALLTK